MMQSSELREFDKKLKCWRKTKKRRNRWFGLRAQKATTSQELKLKVILRARKHFKSSWIAECMPDGSGLSGGSQAIFKRKKWELSKPPSCCSSFCSRLKFWFPRSWFLISDSFPLRLRKHWDIKHWQRVFSYNYLWMAWTKNIIWGTSSSVCFSSNWTVNSVISRPTGNFKT